MYVLGDCRLRDIDPELEQFAVDARRTPQPIGQAHLPDQAADFPWYPRPTTTTARLPAPIQPEALPMPSDDGLRLDNRHSVQHRGKQAIEPDEEQSFRHGQTRLRGHAPTKRIQLMPKQNDLGFQSCLRLEWRDQNVKEQDQEPDHGSSAYLNSPPSSDGVFGKDRSWTASNNGCARHSSVQQPSSMLARKCRCTRFPTAMRFISCGTAPCDIQPTLPRPRRRPSANVRPEIDLRGSDGGSLPREPRVSLRRRLVVTERTADDTIFRGGPNQ